MFKQGSLFGDGNALNIPSVGDIKKNLKGQLEKITRPKSSRTTVIPSNITDETTLEELAKPRLAKPLPTYLPKFIGSNGEDVSGEGFLDHLNLHSEVLARTLANSVHEGELPARPGTIVRLNREEHSGSFPFLPNTENEGYQGQNYGLVTAVSPVPGTELETLSPEAIKEHEEACGKDAPLGRDQCRLEAHDKPSGLECPLRSHLINCAEEDGEHHEGCKLNQQGRLVKRKLGGRLLVHVLPFRNYKGTQFSALDSYGTPKPLAPDQLQTVPWEEFEKALGGPKETMDTVNRQARRYYEDMRKDLADGGDLLPDQEAMNKVVNTFRKRTVKMKKQDLQVTIAPTGIFGGSSSKETPAEKPPTPFASRLGYADVARDRQQIKKAPPCRFCDDPSNWNSKSEVKQTGVSPDGRPLYAHAECETSVQERDWSFMNTNRYEGLDSLKCNNCKVVIDRPGYCPNCIHLATKTVEEVVEEKQKKDLADSTLDDKTAPPQRSVVEVANPGSGMTPAKPVQ